MSTLRNVPRVKVRLFVDPVNGLVIAGRHLKHGEQEATFYVDELPLLESRTQTAQDRKDLDFAQQIYSNGLAQWRKTRGNEKRSESEYDGKSVPAIYYAQTSRSLPPIRKLEKLADLPPPEMPENRTDNQIAALVQSLQSLLAQAQAQPSTSKKG